MKLQISEWQRIIDSLHAKAKAATVAYQAMPQSETKDRQVLYVECESCTMLADKITRMGLS